MSYTPRRTGGIPGNQQAHSVGGIGQRRPVVTNNFVPGGTINTGPAQVKPYAGNQQQQRQVGAPNTSIHFRNQQPQQQQQSRPPTKSEPPQQRLLQSQQVFTQNQAQRQAVAPAQVLQQLPQPQVVQPEQKVFTAQQQQQKTPVEQKVLTAQQTAPVEQKVFSTQQQPMIIEQQQPQLKNEVIQPSQPENGGGESMEAAGIEPQHFQPRRKPWFKRNLTRREMIRRRNFNLSKLLKPKNAVAILNEIVQNIVYEVETVSNRTDGRTFKASVTYDGTVHEGFGFTEDQAKNGAAEVVLKYYIKSNKMGDQNNSEASVEKMDVSTTDDDANVPLPWHHVASFAIYKLFSQWEEDPNLVGISASYLNLKSENRQSRKMPPNPETLNPLMLINQMLPQAKFEESGRTGNPPQTIFSFKCTVDNESFIGSGTSKRIAKRASAYEACHKVLGVTYPPDIFVPAQYLS